MRRFLYKLSVVVVIAWVLILLPSPISALAFEIKNGGVVIAAVLYSGKLLYDTLFYDHYLP